MHLAEAVETTEYKGHTIEIFPDDCDESPREWDNLCTFHCWHKRCNLGDVNYTDVDKINEVLIEAKRNKDIVLPLYIYQHSGIALSLSRTGQFTDRWDAGQVGFVIIEREKALAELIPARRIFTAKMKRRCIEIAEAEVKTYNQYLSGDVYGFKTDTGDSCWGFYEIEEAIKEAKSEVDYVIEKAIKKHCEQVKKWIKHKVPLIYRKSLSV